METGEANGQSTAPNPGWRESNGGLIAPPWKPGQSGNPGGRPKAARLVSAALAELQDAPGETPEACVLAFKAARGAKLCGADHKAIALFRKENNEKSMGQVGAIELALDRLEGKVEQPHAVRAQETDALIRHLADATGIDPEAIRALGAQLGGQG